MHRLVLGLTGLLGAAGATYLAAFLVFGGGSDRAATLVPADALAYVNVYLQPSSGQQTRVAELIGRLPGFADDATLDEKVDQVVQNLLGGTGIDYQADLKPWLGDQVAAAIWPGATADPADQHAAMVVQVKDRPAAEEALPRLVSSLGAGETTEETHGGAVMHVAADGMTWAFVEEMLVVGDSPEAVRDVIDTAAGASDLAGLTEFRAARDRLPGDHLAFAFGNPTALAGSVSASASAASDADACAADGFGPVAAVLMAADEGLRVTGSATVADADDPPDGDGSEAAADPAAVAEWMPAGAAVAVTLFDVAGLIADAEAAADCVPGGRELTDALGALRLMASFGLGIDLDGEVLPMLSREAGLSFSGIEGEAPRAQLIVRPEDPVSALATLDRIAESLSDAGAESRSETTATDVEIVTVALPQLGELSYAGTGEVIILALDAQDVRAAVEANAAGDTLAASAAYRRAFEVAGEAGTSRVYVDISALLEGLGVAETLPADARDILARIGSFGLAVLAPQGGQIDFHAVLIIEDGTE